MTFEQVVKEELSTDLDSIKAQIRQLQVNVEEKDKVIGEKDNIIKDLQAKLSAAAKPAAIVPPQKQANIGIGTRKTIEGPSANPSQTEKI